jgi:hypothetical protein
MYFIMSPFKLRELFAIMLVFCQVSEPALLWEKYRQLFRGYSAAGAKGVP